MSDTILVAGSRGLDNQFQVYGILNSAYMALDMIIPCGDGWHNFVSGGAKGVDSLAKDWFEDSGFAFGPDDQTFTVMPALWETYGKSAGYRRNADMVEIADAAIILWDGRSKGTKHTIDLVRKKGIPHILAVFGRTWEAE